PGIASGQHSRAVLFQDPLADRFGCAQNAGVSHCATERRAQRDDRSDVLWPIRWILRPVLASAFSMVSLRQRLIRRFGQSALKLMPEKKDSYPIRPSHLCSGNK